MDISSLSSIKKDNEERLLENSILLHKYSLEMIERQNEIITNIMNELKEKDEIIKNIKKELDSKDILKYCMK